LDRTENMEKREGRGGAKGIKRRSKLFAEQEAHIEGVLRSAPNVGGKTNVAEEKKNALSTRFEWGEWGIGDADTGSVGKDGKNGTRLHTKGKSERRGRVRGDGEYRQ